MKYLTYKLNGVDVLVEANEDAITVRTATDKAVFAIENGELVVEFFEIPAVEPVEPPKPRGIKRHTKKAKVEVKPAASKEVEVTFSEGLTDEYPDSPEQPV